MIVSVTVSDLLAAFDRQQKGKKIAKDNREFSRKGSPQYIGRPQGPKAKGHKTPATGTLPYVRFSVIPK